MEWSTLSQGPLVADTPAVEVWAVEVGIPINKSEMIHVSGTDHRPLGVNIMHSLPAKLGSLEPF